MKQDMLRTIRMQIADSGNPRWILREFTEGQLNQLNDWVKSFQCRCDDGWVASETQRGRATPIEKPSEPSRTRMWERIGSTLITGTVLGIILGTLVGIIVGLLLS